MIGKENEDRPRPFEELGHREDDDDRERGHRRAPVDDHPVPPTRLLEPQVMLDHAGAGHGEAGEDADGVHRYQVADPGPGDEEQGDGHDGEHDDPVGEDQPMASFGQLGRQEPVLGDETGQEGEAVEAGVAAGVEDQQRWRTGRTRSRRGRRRAGAEHRLGLLREDGRRAVDVGDGVGEVGQPRHPEHQEAEDDAHDHQHPAGVGSLRRPEGTDPVGDGLQAGQRGPAVGEGLEHDEDRRPHEESAPGMGPERERPGGVHVGLWAGR